MLVYLDVRGELKKGEASLACLLQALERTVLRVELKSGAAVTGTVESVDGDMKYCVPFAFAHCSSVR